MNIFNVQEMSTLDSGGVWISNIFRDITRDSIGINVKGCN